LLNHEFDTVNGQGEYSEDQESSTSLKNAQTAQKTNKNILKIEKTRIIEQ
jgi:hypothetical protein